jgi:hypothetical protein
MFVYVGGANSISWFQNHLESNGFYSLDIAGTVTHGTPRSLAISPDGDFVYVANQAEEADAGSGSGSISCFARSVTTGGLSTVLYEYSNSDNNNGFVVESLNNVASVAMSPDGSVVYAMSSDANAGDALTIFARHPTTGALLYLESVNRATSTYFVTDLPGEYWGVHSIAVSPNGNQIYLAGGRRNKNNAILPANPSGAVVHVDVSCDLATPAPSRSPSAVPTAAPTAPTVPFAGVGTVESEWPVVDYSDGGVNSNFGSVVAFLGSLSEASPTNVALAIGDPYDDDGGPRRGAVHILFLSAQDRTVQSWTKISDTASSPLSLQDVGYFGSSVCSLGDVNGDGIGDIATGAYGAYRGEAEGESGGAVYVLFLTAAGDVYGFSEISTMDFPVTLPPNSGVGFR